MKKYELYDVYKNKLKLNGNKFSFSSYNDVDICFDYITQFKETGGYINTSNFAVKTKKEKIMFEGEVDYDEYEETIYTIYRQQLCCEQEDKNSYIKNILGKRVVIEYRKNKKLFKISGPAIEDSGFYFDNCMFNSLPVDLYYQNGIEIPDWVPKLKQGIPITKDINKSTLLKVSLLFDAGYANVLKNLISKSC